MNVKKLIPFYAILLSFLLFFLQHMISQPPQPVSIESPSNHFSAERAYKILEVLLKENEPHPVGSKLNKIIKERLMEELNKLDIEYEEQKTWSCSSRGFACAEVENLIGIIPGKEDLPYLVLMAHYDSVPMAPGAGDDGAGVVAILEAARVLKLNAPYKHPIILLLTDGEESGLLGAEAFFNQHPLAKKTGMVLNVEGSGTSGGSMVLRTSDKNELLLNSFSQEHGNPYGFSLTKEIFKRMPNDTDFSVSLRANIPGIDFAFSGERNHYHTPNDSLENLDIRTIQHHGENILTTSKGLLSSDWSEMGNEYVFFGGPYGFWSQWKTSNNLLILIFSTFLLILALIRSKVNLATTALGVLFSPITLLTTIISGASGFYLLSLLSGNVISWPGIDWPYRLLLIGSTSLGLLVGSALSRKFVQEEEMVYGSWLFWSILTLLVTIFLPDAANIFLLPLLFASILILISTFIKDEFKQIFLLLTLIVSLPSTLGLIFALEQSQGYKLVWATLPFAGLYAVIFSPFLFSLRIKPAISFVGVATVVALTAASSINLYTEKRPQHVNIHFYENLDSENSYIHLSGNYKNVTASDPEPLIAPLSSFIELEGTKPIASFAPDYEFRYWADSRSSGWDGPSVLNKEILKEGKSIKLNLKSNRSASRMILLLPEESNLRSFNLGSLEVEPSLITRGYYKGYYIIYLSGIYDKDTELTLNFSEYQKEFNAFLLDVSTSLPNHLDELYKSRSGIFSPVHRGDQAILIKKVNFKL